MRKPYNAKTLLIDLIIDSEKTMIPYEIVAYAQEQLNENISVKDVMAHLNWVEDEEQVDYSVTMNEIFN
jgi:hypothetical protein